MGSSDTESATELCDSRRRAKESSHGCSANEQALKDLLKVLLSSKKKTNKTIKYGDQKVSYIQQPPLGTRTSEIERGRGTKIQVPDMAQQKVTWGFPATRAVRRGRVSSHTSC